MLFPYFELRRNIALSNSGRKMDRSRVLDLSLHQPPSPQRITDQFISNQFSRHNEFPLSLYIHGPISVRVLRAIPIAVEATSTSRSRTCV